MDTVEKMLLTGISKNDFEQILQAVDGYIDYEFLLIVLALHYMKRARDMYHDGLEEPAEKYEEKSDKIASFVHKYRALNRV